jgi:hypothetical protein
VDGKAICISRFESVRRRTGKKIKKITPRMWFPTSPTSKAWVTWRPRNARLHYAELYRGLWDFLRMPPRRERAERAERYLKVLLENPGSHLQQDRIRWVHAWLEALPNEDARRRRLGEARYALLTWVCYEPPPVVVGWRVVRGKMRAG